MQVEFEKNTLACLQRAAWEVKNEEYTQEVKVPDNMPDIGNVLGAWGQPVLRSKTWHGNGMTAAGGILVWILYIPENETSPRMIESWLPYQFRWDFSQTQQDGTILIRTLLQAMDVRTLTPRKLMLRGVICAAGEALIPDMLETWEPTELPNDVHVLRQRYPVTLPTEAAEKVFSIDETFPLSTSCENADKVMYYSLKPEITDQKIMGDKLVFRGVVKVMGMCRCDEQKLEPFFLELPFSQYAQLQREYAEDAEVMLLPEISNAELELSEAGTLHITGDVVGQYVIYDHPVLELIEDVYSPSRTVTPQWQALEMPAILEHRQNVLRAEGSMETDSEEILDGTMCIAHPALQRQGPNVRLEQPFCFRALWSTPEGSFRGAETGGSLQLDLEADSKTRLLAWSHPSAVVQRNSTPGHLQLRGEITVHTVTISEQPHSMITALDFGQMIKPEPDRPSLILRRVC